MQTGCAFCKKLSKYDTPIVTAAVKRFNLDLGGPDRFSEDRTSLLTIYLFQVPNSIKSGFTDRGRLQSYWYYLSPIEADPAFPGFHSRFLIDTMWPFIYGPDGHLRFHWGPLYSSPNDFESIANLSDFRPGNIDNPQKIIGSYLYCSTHYPRRTQY